jgi:hypothetical protein
LAKIDPREVFEVCECCLFDGEPQICSQCGMFRAQRGRNYFVPRDMSLMAALEIVNRITEERRKDA